MMATRCTSQRFAWTRTTSRRSRLSRSTTRRLFLTSRRTWPTANLRESTIGVAKHPLVGRVKTKRGGSEHALPIEFRGRVQGYAWIPPGRARPIFVSVGNRISLDRSLEIVQRSTQHGYPEALKLADRLCREMKRNEKREKGAARRVPKGRVTARVGRASAYLFFFLPFFFLATCFLPIFCNG